MAEDETTGDAPEAGHGATGGHAGGHGHGPAGAKAKLGPGGGPADKKADRRKATIIVILTGLGVAIAYMSLRSSGGTDTGTGVSGSSANDGSLYPSDGSSDSAAGDVDGSGSDGLAQQLSLLSNQVSALAGTVASTGVTTSPSSPHFHYEAGLHYLFDRKTGVRYQVEANGRRVKITNSQWAKIRGLDPNARKDTTQYGKAPVKTKTKSGGGYQGVQDPKHPTPTPKRK